MGRAAFERFSVNMQRVIIDTNVFIDWMYDGLYEPVIFQRDAVKHLSAVVISQMPSPARLGFSICFKRYGFHYSLIHYRPTRRLDKTTGLGYSSG